MHIRPLAVVLSAVFSLPLGAQKVADSLNETAAVTYYTTAGDWFCIKRPYTTPLVLTALEYRLSNTNTLPANVDFGVWDEDPITLKPRTLLGSGTGVVTPKVPDWYGAKFTAPVLILNPGNY